VIICVDFDDTIVEQAGRDFEDVDTPLRFVLGAKEGLTALKKAGHTLVLFSGRANRALLEDPYYDPLVRAGVRWLDRNRWALSRQVNQARYDQMIRFVAQELPDVFAAIDDGMQGKPCCDLIIDDKALRFGPGVLGAAWSQIAGMWGEPVYNRKG
jgi:hypothetical protein